MIETPTWSLWRKVAYYSGTWGMAEVPTLGTAELEQINL